jgi:hypothetical protein
MAIMNEKDISVGMDLGVYAFCFIMAKQKTPWEPKQFENFAAKVAENIEREVGMPAEDVALHMIPIMEQAINQIGGIK